MQLSSQGLLLGEMYNMLSAVAPTTQPSSQTLTSTTLPNSGQTRNEDVTESLQAWPGNLSCPRRTDGQKPRTTRFRIGLTPRFLDVVSTYAAVHSWSGWQFSFTIWPSRRNDELIRRCLDGDLSGVRQLIEMQGASPLDVGSHGRHEWHGPEIISAYQVHMAS